MTLETLEIQPLTPNATVTRAHDADAGLDLHCIEDFHIDGLGRIAVGTGIAIKRLDKEEPTRRSNIVQRGINRNFNKYWDDYYSHPLTYEYHPTLETICERSR